MDLFMFNNIDKQIADSQIHKNDMHQIQNWELPLGYSFILQTDSANLSNEKKITKSRLAITLNSEAFLVTPRKIYDLKNISVDISRNYDGLFFALKAYQNGELISCNISVNQSNIPKSIGPWLPFWTPAIQRKLEVKRSNPTIYLATIQHHRTPKNSFNRKNNKPAYCLCVVENQQVKTYPNLNIPPLEKATSWKATTELGSKMIEVVYNLDGIPEKYIFQNIPGIAGENIIEKLQEKLNSLKQHDSFPIKDMGIFSLYFPFSDEQKEALLDLNSYGITAHLPNTKSAIIQFPYYLCCQGKCLLISANYENVALLTIPYKGLNNISEKLQQPINLFSDDYYEFGFYFDSKEKQKINILRLYEYGLSVNNESLDYSAIKDIELIEITSGIFEISLNLVSKGKNKAIKLIASEDYAFNTKKAIELHKIKYNASQLSASDLYQTYNNLKKYNLLTGIFSDIILLKRELNSGQSMAELAVKFSEIDANQLFEDKKLYEATQRKILLLSLMLPKIKQNFEYLASYYPYYHLQNEIDLLSGVFGNSIAQEMVPYERKRIISSSRGNVRRVQTKIQTIISEIERTIYPIEQLFSKEKMNDTISNKISKYLPHAAQATLAGVGIVTGGASIIVGMLAIRTTNDVMNYFRNDREGTAQIKKAFEKLHPWWQLLEDIIPVALFETADAIDQGNNYSVERDNRIIKQFPKEKQTDMVDRMKNVLNQKIQEGTESKFSEITEGSGIRFESMILEIKSVLDRKLPDYIENITRSFALPQLEVGEEKKNG